MKAREGQDAGHSRARAAIGAICRRIEGGTHVNHACALEYVARSSFYWVVDHDPEIAALVAASRAVAAEARRAEVERAARGEIEGANPNVLLHLLERAHPDEYAPAKQRVEQSGPGGGPQEHAIVVRIDDALEGAKEDT